MSCVSHWAVGYFSNTHSRWVGRSVPMFNALWVVLTGKRKMFGLDIGKLHAFSLFFLLGNASTPCWLGLRSERTRAKKPGAFFFSWHDTMHMKKILQTSSNFVFWHISSPHVLVSQQEIVSHWKCKRISTSHFVVEDQKPKNEKEQNVERNTLFCVSCFLFSFPCRPSVPSDSDHTA